MVRKILSVPSKRLRLVSEIVKPEDLISLASLFKDLRDTLGIEGDNGLGLAAPQINVRKRVILVKVIHSSSAKPIPTIIINPVITDRYETVKGPEACLSVPGRSGIVERSRYIHVDFMDEEGIERKAIFHDNEAILIQHEMDHLDGILFIDKVENERT